MNDDSTSASDRDKDALEADGWPPETYDILVLGGFDPGEFADAAAVPRDEESILILCNSDDPAVNAFGRRILSVHPNRLAIMTHLDAYPPDDETKQLMQLFEANIVRRFAGDAMTFELLAECEGISPYPPDDDEWFDDDEEWFDDE